MDTPSWESAKQNERDKIQQADSAVRFLTRRGYGPSSDLVKSWQRSKADAQKRLDDIVQSHKQFDK